MIDEQCASCEYAGDMRVVGEDSGYLEAVCPVCGESTYQRIED